ncbi:Uncharacterised protein [uncultured archaeon]|nr:Uncharacterised protein [uncultured archaeon]
MAEIKSIDMHKEDIEVKLSISKEEYKVLQHHMSDIVILPSGRESLAYSLTTGKLGNSNRVMLPKKMLEAFRIAELDKKVPSNLFTFNGNTFLLIKLKGSEFGIPKFKD